MCLSMCQRQSSRQSSRERELKKYSCLFWIAYINTKILMFRTLGIQKIRRLNMSRGAREGNTAFTKDQNNSKFGGFVQNLQMDKKIMRWNLSLKFINELITLRITNKDELCHRNIIEAIR